MEKFKVIASDGIHFNGEHHKKGDTLSLSSGAVLSSFLHFKQVAPVTSKEKDPEEEIRETDRKARAAENADHDLKDGGKPAKK